MPTDASVGHASGLDGNAWPSLRAEDDLVIVASVETPTFVFVIAITQYVYRSAVIT